MIAPGFRRFLVPVARLAPIEPFLWPAGALQECEFQTRIERDETCLEELNGVQAILPLSGVIQRGEEDSRNYRLGEFIAPEKKTS